MESTANVIFPYSVLICVKSRLRGFRCRAIHAASTVSAIRALQAVARSSTSNTIQAVARNKRSRSGSAQSAQLAQSTRQRTVSASRASQAVARNKYSPSVSARSAQSEQSAQSQRQCAVGVARAENSALRTFRAIFFERQCVWRGRQCAPINKKPFRGTTRARAPPENNCPFF